MVNLQTLLPFASIIILVVVELSRQSSQLDLEDIVRRKDRTMFPRIPNLGFVSIVHALNVFFLMVTYFVIYLESGWDSLPRNLVLIAVVAMLFLVPYLEIQDYDLLLERAGVFNSRDIHLIFSLLILIEPIAFKMVGAATGPLELVFLGTLVFALVYYGSVYFFLKSLRDEFEEERTQARLYEF